MQSGTSAARPATRVLVTGATGYVGGRLAPRLVREGYDVRCMARDPDRLRDVPWRSDVEVVPGDALDADSLRRALDGVDVAYYLIHSLSARGFEDTERVAAANFRDAAASSGVGRIVYLGGLRPLETSGPGSAHLSSRAEVGDVFLAGPVPAIVLQAGVIIGSGSASFEMLRHLVERLPVMVTPKWVASLCQPIAIRDVLRYLVAAATFPQDMNRSFDIGGPEVMSYLEMMRRYAEVARLPRRIVIPVPVLRPRLSSLWVNFVTPVPSRLARPLIDSLVHSVVTQEDDIRDLVPGDLLAFDESVALALRRVRDGDVLTRWSGAMWPDAPSDPIGLDPDWTGGTLRRDVRERHVDASQRAVFGVLEGIGGARGWYSLPLAWWVRGLLDRMVGGVGLRRGRRDPDSLQVGDAVDFWRVEELDRPHVLRLRAEMKLPGRAWLEFRVDPEDGGGPGCVLVQRALFRPHGFLGLLYWWAVYPFHGIVFGSMIRNLAGASEADAGGLR